MKQFFLLISLVSTTLVLGQNSTQINGQDNEGQCSEIILDTSINLFGDLQISNLSDDYTISQVTIVGNCLVLNVVFGGGCGTSNFRLLMDGSVTESMVPQIRFLLVLKDEDMCKALVYETIKFDISNFNGYKLGSGLTFRIMNSDFVLEWPE